MAAFGVLLLCGDAGQGKSLLLSKKGRTASAHERSPVLERGGAQGYGVDSLTRPRVVSLKEYAEELRKRAKRAAATWDQAGPPVGPSR